MPIDHLENDHERAEYLQNLLIGQATNGVSDDGEYQLLRSHFLGNEDLKPLVPDFVRTRRDLDQFWQFIKYKFPHYYERREFIWAEFAPLLEYLESGCGSPPEQPISEMLQRFNQDTIHRYWLKALERKGRDPEGAITASRALIESTCKHILDRCDVKYSSGIELPHLYKLTANELNLAPEQHGEQIFKQILGGCSGVVSGLGSLRNHFGDAHGTGKSNVRPAPRHAELAVNLAGTMAVFLVTTYEAIKDSDNN